VRVLLTTEAHFFRNTRGELYAEGQSGYSTWSKYIDVFGEALVLARVGFRAEALPEQTAAAGLSVSFCALPDYRGPWQYIRRLPELKSIVRQTIGSCDAFILRVPGLVGRLVWRELRRLGRPYALEVVGDPWDTLAPETLRSALRPIYRMTGTRELKIMCAGAAAIHYVTESALQKRYPAAPDAYTVAYPNALMDSAYVTFPTLQERFRRLVSNKPIRIGFIGSLAQMYKGPDVLLRASSLCRARGHNFEVVMVGEGRYAEQMKALAKRLEAEDKTQFIPRLPFGKPIFDFLDSVDLFVMPSRAEGLPRALVEAMARGCPCIGSNVGGIPELLAPEDLVPPNDPEALAQKIMEVTADPTRMKEMSERNLARAKQFDPEVLRQARLAFYRYVRDHSGSNAKSGREQQSTLQPL
jgi:glycosyltransferase involved in cell wall biosynthesis